MRLVFDHADLVAQHGARVDGSNLQIMASDGTSDQELHRVLDPGSRWNDAQTQVWFAISEDLAAGQTDNRRYFLVVHPSVTAPRQDGTRVFLAYDHFDGSSLDTSTWAAAAETVGPGEQALRVQGGELILTATATGSGKRSQTVRSVANWQEDSIAMDALVRTNSNLTFGGLCTREFLTGFWAPSPSTYIRSLFLHDNFGYGYANHRDTDPYDFIVQDAESGLSGPEKHRYSLRWRGPTVEAAVDGTVLRTFFTRDSSFTEPAKGPLIAGFEAVAIGGCAGVQSHLAIDWVMVRKAARTEPSLSLLMGQATRREL